MVLSLGVILFGGFIIGILFEKIRLPKIVGMLIYGILLGPSLLNIVSIDLINISASLRQIALVIILTRSGLSLNIKSLKEIGRPAILMSLIPATFEIIGILIFGPLLLKISYVEALLIGTILAAVSPAIIVPRMIKLQNEKYGTNKQIPELIMAGASVDDIYVIILFYAFLGLNQGGSLTVLTFIQIPLAIILGVLVGLVIGCIISYLFKKLNFNKLTKTLILLSTSLVLVGLENFLKQYIQISFLLSIVTIGIVILFKDKEDAKLLNESYNNLWTFFEIILFVLVGISVDLSYAVNSGFMPVLVLVIGLLFRTIGVYISLFFTNYNFKERLFIIISYLPKATVQASIGGISLSLGLDIGPLALTISVLAILITAPIGAILMDYSYKRLLLQEPLSAY